MPERERERERKKEKQKVKKERKTERKKERKEERKTGKQKNIHLILKYATAPPFNLTPEQILQ